MSETTKTFRKGNLLLVLDREQVVPDNPGDGTPAMVYWCDPATGRNRFSATYACACGEGELEGGDYIYTLSDAQVKWLNGLDDEVEKFLTGNPNINPAYRNEYMEGWDTALAGGWPKGYVPGTSPGFVAGFTDCRTNRPLPDWYSDWKAEQKAKAPPLPLKKLFE